MAGIAWSWYMAFRLLVAVAADILRGLLPIGVAACTGCALVSPYQCDGVVWKLCFLEASWCVALLAGGSIMRIPGWLVAVGTLSVYSRAQPLMAIKTPCFSVSTNQGQWVHGCFHLCPRLGGLVAGVALHGWHWRVGREVAGIAVSKFTIELPGLVAVETDSHGANDITSDWVKAVTDSAVTVTARYI